MAYSFRLFYITTVFALFWKIWFYVFLAILFWNLFYSAQNDVDSKFIYFAFLVQFFYSRILIESFLINSYCLFLLLPFFIKFILFLHWIFNVFSYSWLRYYFVFSFFMVLIGACLSKILLMKRKKVSKPKFISLFSVTNDQ